MGRFFGNIEIDGLKKGPWTPEEDQKLIHYIQKYGHGCWQLLPKKARLNRCGKSCRLRWTNYLRPDIKRGNFSPQEEQTIIDLHSVMGNKWSMIANRLPGRTDNEIKNFWNTHLRKKLLRSGIDPKTHQLINNLSFINMNTLENLAKIQLLRNILQLMNANPMLPSVLSGSELVKQFNGVPYPLQVSSVDNSLNLSSYNHHQPIMETFHEISEFQYGRNNGVRNTEDGNSLQNPNYEQLMWAKNCDTSEFIAVDDETTSSFWKDIFNESFFAPSE